MRKHYVGCNPDGTMEAFKYSRDPVPSDGLPYLGVIGPFVTKRGADFMVKYGRGNPHIRCVADAERIARKYRV